MNIFLFAKSESYLFVYHRFKLFSCHHFINLHRNIINTHLERLIWLAIALVPTFLDLLELFLKAQRRLEELLVSKSEMTSVVFFFLPLFIQGNSLRTMLAFAGTPWPLSHSSTHSRQKAAQCNHILIYQPLSSSTAGGGFFCSRAPQWR